MTSYRPEYWRTRAEKTLAKAEMCRDGNTRDMLLRVAGEYEQLARRAEQWQTVLKQAVQEQAIRAELPADNWRHPTGDNQEQIPRSAKLTLVYANPSALHEDST